MPRDEVHLVDMLFHRKVMRTVDGVLTYQYRKLEYAVKLCKQKRVAVDVGGHVGLWSMHLVNVFEHVVAFEPLEAMADIFTYNVPQDRARLHRVALGPEAGSVALAFDKKNTGHSHINGSGSIPMRTLDSYELSDVDFIKIDVEGFELGVVQGAEETIKRCRPVMVVEQKKNDARRGQELNGATKLLERWGMKRETDYGGDYIMIWPELH